MLHRIRFPAVLFFTASVLGLWPIYFALSANGWWQSAGALAYGLLLGFAVQRCFREPVPRCRIAAGAFLGAFMLWTPVVLTTYGLALAATPIFVAYAAAATLGATAATRRQRWR
ncbi:hypothetical protein AcdelDRAFT_4637, partial [Acidovorax delafieldii 2AN]